MILCYVNNIDLTGLHNPLPSHIKRQLHQSVYLSLEVQLNLWKLFNNVFGGGTFQIFEKNKWSQLGLESLHYQQGCVQKRGLGWHWQPLKSDWPPWVQPHLSSTILLDNGVQTMDLLRENLDPALEAGPSHSYESCSVANKAKNGRLPGSNITQILRMASALCAFRAGTLVTSTGLLANFQCSALLIWMEIK